MVKIRVLLTLITRVTSDDAVFSVTGGLTVDSSQVLCHVRLPNQIFILRQLRNSDSPWIRLFQLLILNEEPNFFNKNKIINYTAILVTK
jgi:hypothetical protein